MKLLRSLLYAALCCASAGLTGCATQDRPWDPPRGQALFEQIRPWDHKASRVCGGHLRPEKRLEGMTDRC